MTTYIEGRCTECDKSGWYNKEDAMFVCKHCGADQELVRGYSADKSRAINYTIGDFHARIPSGFKDVLKDMKSKGGRGSKIDV